MNQVLVVDDEAAMRTALAASFARNGWRVETAAGTTEAMAKFRRGQHPLVVTDIRMPDGATVGCWQGMKAEGGAEGVGRATTRSVVVGSICVLILNFFLSKGLPK